MTRFRCITTLLLIVALAMSSCASNGQQHQSTAAPTACAPHGSHEHAAVPVQQTPAESSEQLVEPEPTEVPAVSEEQAAYERARPVFESYCASCHSGEGNAGARAHFDMNAYPFGGHHANEITTTIRRALGTTGQRPTMPRDRRGVVQGAELDAVLAWADAADRAREATPRAERSGHGHHH